jgi:hypothetical protein
MTAAACSVRLRLALHDPDADEVESDDEQAVEAHPANDRRWPRDQRQDGDEHQQGGQRGRQRVTDGHRSQQGRLPVEQIDERQQGDVGHVAAEEVARGQVGYAGAEGADRGDQLR